MREFFWGWKRKCGVVTLLIACVFAAGWVRSCTVDDVFHLFGLRFVSTLGAIERSTVTFRGIGSGFALNDVMVFWRVPYWSIVIPLTLLSAWLLLSNPRTVNPKSIPALEA
jgi:hypothetical protein